MCNCLNGSICFELLKGIPAAIVTLVIGLIAAGISWRQYRTATAKLKLDLFERRFKIFHGVWVIFSGVVINGAGRRNQGFATPFNNILPETRFLFGEKIERYLNDAATKWIELQAAESQIDPMRANDQQEWIERRTELILWFEDQAQNGIRQQFGQYLNFEEWK